VEIIGSVQKGETLEIVENSKKTNRQTQTRWRLGNGTKTASIRNAPTTLSIELTNNRQQTRQDYTHRIKIIIKYTVKIKGNTFGSKTRIQSKGTEGVQYKKNKFGQ